MLLWCTFDCLLESVEVSLRKARHQTEADLIFCQLAHFSIHVDVGFAGEVHLWLGHRGLLTFWVNVVIERWSDTDVLIVRASPSEHQFALEELFLESHPFGAIARRSRVRDVLSNCSLPQRVCFERSAHQWQLFAEEVVAHIHGASEKR